MKILKTGTSIEYKRTRCPNSNLKMLAAKIPRGYRRLVIGDTVEVCDVRERYNFNGNGHWEVIDGSSVAKGCPVSEHNYGTPFSVVLRRICAKRAAKK